MDMETRFGETGFPLLEGLSVVNSVNNDPAGIIDHHLPAGRKKRFPYNILVSTQCT